MRRLVFLGGACYLRIYSNHLRIPAHNILQIHYTDAVKSGRFL